MIILAGKISSNSITFPISFTSRMIGLAFSQSAAASSRISRIAIKSITKTTLNLEGCESATMANGAYYISIAY